MIFLWYYENGPFSTNFRRNTKVDYDTDSEMFILILQKLLEQDLLKLSVSVTLITGACSTSFPLDQDIPSAARLMDRISRWLHACLHSWKCPVATSGRFTSTITTMWLIWRMPRTSRSLLPIPIQQVGVFTIKDENLTIIVLTVCAGQDDPPKTRISMYLQPSPEAADQGSSSSTSSASNCPSRGVV